MLEHSGEKNKLVRLSETHKRFIQTVIDQLPPYIEEYPADEQQLLNEFLNTLKYYEEADYQRDQLSNRFSEYYQHHEQTQKYLDTPFLWFAADYFSHANLKLSLAKFDGRTFYEYLTKPLKRTAQCVGLFALIKDKTSLMDLKWENLQVTSTRIIVNLLEEQLIALNSVHKSIDDLGVHSLNSTVLRKRVRKETSKFPFMRDLVDFHRLIESQWTLWFYPPAFDLSRFYINFSLPDNAKISDLIDYNDLRNTTLCNSRFFYMPESKNEYCGYLTIPSRFNSVLKEIIDFNQEKENIIVKKYEEITMERLATSLTLYDVKKGWKDSNPKSYKKKHSKLNITPKFNNAWNIKKFVEPTKLIQIYCHPSGTHSFDTLPLNKINSNDTSQNRFSALEMGLVKYLYKKGVCRITYIANRLLYAYSPFQYEIILPSMSSDRIERLVAWMPFARLFHTENHIFLWVYLTPKTAMWIQNELKWPVRQIIAHHFPTFADLDYYNFDACEWKKPLFIKANSS